MPTLSPQVQFQIRPESPVDMPGGNEGYASVLGTAGRVIGNVLDASATRTTGSGQDDNALYQGVVNGLKEVQALRDQGREQEALQMERRIEINFNRLGGDSGDSRYQELVSSYTGRPAENFGFSQEEVIVNDIMETSEFQAAYTATYGTHPPDKNKDMTEEERLQLAMSSLARQNASATILGNANFEWNAGKEQMVMDFISDFENNILGALNIAAEQDGVVTLEERQQAVAALNAFRTQLYSLRPVGIDNEQWNPVEDRLNAIGKTLEYLEGLEGADNLDARATSRLIQTIQSLPDMKDVDKNIWTRVIAGDPDLFREVGIMTGEEEFDLLSALRRQEDITETERMDPNSLPDIQDEDVGDPQAQFRRATVVLENANQAGNTIMNSEQTRKNWSDAVSVGLAYANALGTEGKWLTADQYEKMFGPAFQQNLNKMKKADPELYTVLHNKAQGVLTRTASVINRQLISLTEGSPWEFNPNTGEFRVSREGFVETLPEGAVRDGVMSAVDRFYDGDLVAAIEDNGARIDDRLVRTTFQQASFGLADISDNMEAMGNALSTLTHIQNQLVKNTADTVRISENQEIPESFAPIKAGIFATESGGGDYDALFGFSQRAGGRFEGVKITEMTVDEAIEFSNPRGEYGNWVRQRLGELGQDPRVATPMGAYQIVGSTLKMLKKDMGLTGDEIMTPELQDRLGYRLYQLQGTDAWEGYKGPVDPSTMRMRATGTGDGVIRGIPVGREGPPMPPGDSQPSVQATPAPPRGPDIPSAASGAPVPTQSVPEARGAQGVDNQRTGQVANEMLSRAAIRQLQALNLDPTQLPRFDTEDQVEAALDAGSLEPGQVFLFRGRPMRAPDE